MGIKPGKMILLVIFFAGIILRFVNLNQSLGLDEAINVLATQKFSFWGMISEYAVADFHPPGFFIILWLWTKLFGIGEIFVRIPSLVFGVVTIYFVYLLGKKIYSKQLGLLAALLLAINPLHIYYSQEARMYSLATFAAVLSFYLLFKLIKEEKVNIIVLVASNLLLLSSDYLAYFSFPAQFVILLLVKKDKIILWGKAILLAIVLGLWWVPIFLKQLSTGSLVSSNLPTWKFVVGGFDIKAIPLTLVKFIIGRISLADKFIYAILLLPVCTIFIFFVLRGIKFISKVQRVFLISWLAIPILIASLVSLIVPIYSYFRLLFTLPAFILLVSLGIISIKSKLKYIFLGLVLIIEIFSALVYLLNNFYQKENWKGAVSFLKTVDPKPLVYFESSGTLPPFDYYAKGEIAARGALKDFPAKSQKDLIDLKTETINLDSVYLVEYLVDISDPNRLVQKELDNLGFVKVDTKNFTGVGFIYRYVRK